MQYRWLGKTGVRVSPLGLGTMTLGKETDLAQARRMWQACRERGINLVDCANVYANGDSELMLGELIADCRDELVLCSKAYFPTGSGPNDRGSSRYHLVRSVENSLRRLATDRIDIFYLHRFDANTDPLESLRALDDLVVQGKILYPAASNFAAWQVSRALGMSRARGLAEFACIQPMYNLVKRQAEVELLPMARGEGLGVVSYSPLGGGLLTGKYVAAGPSDAGGRLRERDMYRVRYADRGYHGTAADFVGLCRELGHHPVSVAVAWAATHPDVTTALIGGRNLEQLAPALAALDLVDKMSGASEVRQRICALSPEPPPATDRNEECVQPILTRG